MSELLVDDGVVPRKLSIPVLIKGLKDIRKSYLECLNGKKPEICYAIAVNSLVEMFGSLLPRVIHSPDLRYYIIVGVEELLVYDADQEKYNTLPVDKAVEKLL